MGQPLSSPQTIPYPKSGIPFQSLPFDVFEMVLETVSFVDLPYFLQTSKSINSAVKQSRLWKRLSAVVEQDLKSLHSNMAKCPDSWGWWPSHEVLKTYHTPYCSHCGDFGMYFIWCSAPILKLCEICKELPRYRFIKLGDGLAHYGLRATDVKSLPIIWHGGYRYPDGKAGIFSKFDRRRGGPFPRVAQVKLQYAPFHSSCWATGAVTLSTFFDFNAGRRRRVMLCGHCIAAKHMSMGYDDKLRYLRKLPQSFEHLREHIATAHPALLESYDGGWEMLPQRFQSRFNDSDVPPNQSGFSLFHDRSGLRHFPPLRWLSWPQFAVSEIPERDMPCGCLRIPELQDLRDLVMEKIEHEGSVFRMPSTPDGFEGFHVPERPWEGCKKLIAEKVVAECVYRAGSEIAMHFKKKIEEQGFEALTNVLNGEPVLREFLQ